MNIKKKIVTLPQNKAASGETITLRAEERQRCEVWTRVMGYHRPYSSFNIGKKGEFKERRYFIEERTTCARAL